ncbi:MAG: endonuclease MutS2, partial [Armatimonadetes bacterium]|nr:endonuclease MutS2 [Candidatus Hippobium faecium]
MDKHTLNILEFEKIIDLVRSRCATEIGKIKCDDITPKTNAETVRILLNEVEEMKNILDREGSVPFRQIYDIKSQLATAKVGQVLNAEELIKINTTFRSLTGLFSFILAQKSEKPLLIAKQISSVPDFSPVIGEIEKCLDYDGTVFDNASGNLNKIRTEIRNTEAKIRDKINQIATSSKYRQYLSDPIVTERNGRFCVPVKSEYKSQIPGIVHDSSGSGQTLFVEPGIIVDMGNRLKDAYGREREEIYRILASLSEKVGQYADSGIYALEIAADLDTVYAKACVSYDLKAYKPKINEKGHINLIGARHPLLFLKNPECVPIDINLGYKFNCLLITGPNTGGKTVTLKTLGVCVLMAMCGMFVPCEADSEISIFKDIFTDIGDEQSIEQSLSTFSAHMKNIVSICEEANSHCLVLLDELGAGTDPSEGSALARGIIEYLNEKEAKIVATTHYGELKNFAFVTDGIGNGSVEFDTVSLKPTYRLLIGVPGSSNAFHIAKRMGIKDEILAKAESAQNREKDAGQEIIEKIEEVHREAGRDRIEAAKRLKEIEAIKADYEEKITRLEKREATIEDKIKKRANKIIRQYTEKIGETLEAIKKTESENEERQSLKKDLTKLVGDFEFEIRKPMKQPQKRDDRPDLENVTVGERVWVRSLAMTGTVEEYKSDSKIVVMVGSMKMTVAKSNLAQAMEEPQAPKKQNMSIGLSKAAQHKSEIRLLGMRAEEAILALDKFLDNAVTA